MKVASENIPTSGVGVVSVSLADNDLRDIAPVTDLASYFPNLKNLSLQNNQIARWTDLDVWATQRKFPQLQELLLLDNPIQRNAPNPDDYRRQCARRFPSLKVLDGTPLPTVPEISFGVGRTANRTTELPAKIRQGAWGEGSNEIGVGFLGVFFPLFDTNRPALLQQFYTPTSLFSVSVDTTTPHQRPDRRGAPTQTSGPSNLGAYIHQSRNLIRNRGEHARMTRLHQGRDQIAVAFQQFPPTKHPIEEPAAFVADGFQVQIGASAGIMVVVHGEFVEMAGRQNFRRSFDRTFLLGPPVPATNPGAQCVVVSDLLVWRQYSGRDAWVPEEGPTAPVPESLVNEHPEVVKEHMMITEVRQRTQMNEHYARLLLQECNGDIEAGVRRFEEAKVCSWGEISNWVRR